MRTKHSFYNFLVSTIAAVIVPLAGIIKVRLFVDLYGSSLNGLQVTIAQVITFLNICELAYSLAFRQLLYKPLAEDDREGVLRLYKGAKRIFHMTGIVVIMASVLLALLFPYFADSPLDYMHTAGTFLLLALPYGISYFIMGPNLVIIADQKEYKISIWIQSFVVLRMLLMVIAIKLKMSFFWILMIEGSNILLCNTVARAIALKAYPWLRDYRRKEPSDAFERKAGYAVIQRLSELATTQTDNIVITAFMGYEITSVYGTYSYLTDSVSKITQSMVTSPMNSFGNLFSTDNKGAYGVFKEFFNFTAYVSSIVAIVIFTVMPQFVHIWMNKPLYEVSVPVCLAFALNIFYLTMRQPVIIARDTNGLYVNAKNNAYLMAASKIVLSVLLIQKFGILGVILATTFTNWTVDFLYNPKLVYDKVFQRKVFEYYGMVFLRLLIAFVIGAGAYYLWTKNLAFISVNLLHFLIAVMVLGMSVFALMTLVYGIAFPSFRNLFVRVLDLLRGRK